MAYAICNDFSQQTIKTLKILDLGGGEGFFMRLFLKSFKKIYHNDIYVTSIDQKYGNDTFKDYYKKLKEEFDHLEIFLYGNDLNDGLPDNIREANIVFANYILHHLEDWEYILEELCERLVYPWYLVFANINSEFDNLIDGELKIDESECSQNIIFDSFYEYYTHVGLKRTSQCLTARNSSPIWEYIDHFTQCSKIELKYEIVQKWNLTMVKNLFKKEPFRRLSNKIFEQSFKKKTRNECDRDQPITFKRIHNIYFIKVIKNKEK